MVVTEERLEKINRTVEGRQKGVIVLEDIHDPHNAQAVIRSCDAFGFQKIYFIFDKEKQFDPTKVGKLSSAAANKWVEFKFFSNTKECFDELKKEGYEIWATVLKEGAKDIFQTNFIKENIALTLGNERDGLSKYAIEHSDHHIIIPMQGMTQSFNLSVTASIFMFEISRQRKASAKNYSYSQEEKNILREKFLAK